MLLLLISIYELLLIINYYHYFYYLFLLLLIIVAIRIFVTNIMIRTFKHFWSGLDGLIMRGVSLRELECTPPYRSLLSFLGTCNFCVQFLGRRSTLNHRSLNTRP